jgi:hypothetical protein
VISTCNPSTQEDEAGESRVSDLSGLYSKFKASQSYLSETVSKEKKKVLI